MMLRPACALASACRQFARGLRCRDLLDQAGDGIGELRATMLPIVNAIEREAQTFFAFAGDGVIEADAFDESTVTPIARIRDNDIEEWPLLGAASSQSDDYHC